MEYVYILTEYEYNSYSYSGVSGSKITVHKTKEGALAHAKGKKLKIVEDVNNPEKEATIEKYELN